MTSKPLGRLLALSFLFAIAAGQLGPKQTSDAEKMLCDLVKLVRNVVLIVGAIVIIFHAFHLFFEPSPEKREEVKKRILFVIAALALVAIAEPLAELILGMDIC